MTRALTRSRLLTSTAALSVVLASLAPVPLLAQDAAPTEAAPTTLPPTTAPAEEAAPETEAPAEAAPEAEAVPSEADPSPAPAPEATAPAPAAPEAAPAAPSADTPAAPAPAPDTPQSDAPEAAEPDTAAPTDDAPAPEASTPEPAATEVPEPATPTEAPAPADAAEPATDAPAPDAAADEAADAPAPSAPVTDAPADKAPAGTDQTTDVRTDAVDTLKTLLGGETEAPAAAAAAAAAAGGSAATSADETVTEVTEQDARSSSEDFETTASGEQRADKDDDDGGLSKLEKVGLLALGGLAVGALMNNGDEVVSNTGDRVVLRQNDGSYQVLKDDDALLRQPGATVRTETFADGSTRSYVDQADGSRVETIRDASGRVLRRSLISATGTETLLIDDTRQVEPVDVSQLPQTREDLRVSATDRTSLRDALARIEGRENARGYSLEQIRDYRQVRALAPVVDVDNITFRSGSAAVEASQAEQLSDLGNLLRELIDERPGEVFLIEGHTDATGSAAANLALSDRRAESVALALTEYFDVPPENLVVQGYGESDLRIDTEADEPRNRRVAVRIITPLLQVAQAR